MSNISLRQQAIDLRLQGKTYSQIKKSLSIPKSTLSDWLSTYPLTDLQIELLQKNKIKSREQAVEKYRNTMCLKREDRLNTTYNDQQHRLLPLSKKELELAGLFLYWGEGQKKINGAVSISNTDPKVIKFALFWLLHSLMIPKEKIRIHLHLYTDMKLHDELRYWSTYLNISPSQFVKPYIKKSFRNKITHKGYGHGTCNLVVGNVLLKEKIMMSIKAISDYYGDQLSRMI